MNIPNLFLSALLIGFSGTAASARENAPLSIDPATRVTVRMRMLPNGLAEVPVFINGRGPFHFVLDTATETSLIDTDLAKEIGLKPIDRLNLQTPKGGKTLIRTYAEELSVGVFTQTKLELLEERLNGAVVKGAPVEGILGQNFLSQFDLLIDYKQRELSLWHAGTGVAPPGRKIPLGVRNHCPTVDVQTGRDRPLHLYLDSGTTAITIFRASQDFRPCLLKGCGGTLVNTVGSIPLVEGRLTAVILGDADLRDVPAFFSSDSQDGGTGTHSRPVEGLRNPARPSLPSGRDALTAENQEDTLDGMIPTNLFSIVYIATRESYAVIAP